MSEQSQNHTLAESLSALMDNQASELELQRVLKASESDAELKLTWARYQAISASLRGEQTAVPSSDFVARLSAALESEPAHTASTISQPKKTAQPQILVEGSTVAVNEAWWHQAGRVALAASVAVAVVMGANHFGQSTNQTVDVAANTPAPTSSVNLPVSTPLNTRTVALQSGYEVRPQETRRVQFQPRVSGQPSVSEEDVARYVNQLIQVHSDNAAQNSGQGVLPYARVILTEDE